jgi:hypothetical protein
MMQEDESYFPRAHPFPGSIIDKNKHSKWNTSGNRQV